MIKNLQIKNFKGLSDLKVNDVSRVNLIGGCNNVGKSSLLEALFLFHARTSPNMFLSLHSFRGLQSVGLTPEAMWAPMFPSFDMESEIDIIVETDKKEIQELIFRFNKQYGRKIKIPTTLRQLEEIKTNLDALPSVALAIIYRSNLNKKNQEAHLLIESDSVSLDSEFMALPVKPAAFLGAARIGDPQKEAEFFGKIDVQGKQNEIIEFINSSIEPRLIGLSTIAIANKTALYAQLKGINRKIPVSYLGDGMVRLLSIILTLSNSQNGSLFIDEIENGIHYSVLPKIWHGIMAAAQKFNCQIFATTHSYECLASAVKGIDDNLSDEFRYIRLDRDNEKLFSTTYSFDELSASIEREWEVR